MFSWLKRRKPETEQAIRKRLLGELELEREEKRLRGIALQERMEAAKRNKTGLAAAVKSQVQQERERTRLNGLELKQRLDAEKRRKKPDRTTEEIESEREDIRLRGLAAQDRLDAEKSQNKIDQDAKNWRRMHNR